MPNDRSAFAIKSVCFKAVLHQWRRLQLELWCLDVEKQGHNIGCFKILELSKSHPDTYIWFCGNGNPPCFLSEIRLEMVDKRTHPSIHVGPENADDSKLKVSKGSQGKRVSIETKLQLLSGSAQASLVQLLVTIKRRRMWLDRTYRILVVLSSRGDVWLCQSGERNWCDVLHSLKWESRSTRKKTFEIPRNGRGQWQGHIFEEV